MAQATYLASTLAMGLLAVGVVVLVLRGRQWYQYVPEAAYGLEYGGGQPRSALSSLVRSDDAWAAAFVLILVGIIGATIVTLEGTVPVMGIVAVLGVAILVFVLAGVYAAMRSNGRPSAQAAAGSVLTFGFLLLLAISVKLVLGV
jgi:hypothetical protein